ncbi:hypothetical protein HN51_024932 [Arachis hypogaea]|uniref:Transcriptional corepressor SEUSS n=2 Tax=Arachis TaxID=3817 RepID=A0A445C7T6_ARAHY|nr:transcriptional corepressor SEUSS-like [Arachis duranensis]XP_025607880.1 transcriptional corepressor SEUSS-like [Arachis hypogaea]QHO28023.1 Transcriptional corepressor SEUSS [Arachis hypogaea]RYR47027.1 hypothetical protein Ahy_A07g032931 [Arachis hypogaea]
MQPSKEVASTAANFNMLNHQQQCLRGMPQQQQPPVPQIPVQFQQQRNILPIYQSGVCAKKMQQFVHCQQRRPADNNIIFWKRFVAELFAPNGKKSFCFSLYPGTKIRANFSLGSMKKCDICKKNPVNGYEACFDVLPRLLKVKYESGLLEERLFTDIPGEFRDPSGYIVLVCKKARRESLFDKFRVVHEGSIRIVFSPYIKICSWEFCVTHHEVFISRSHLVPNVNQIGDAISKFQNFAANNNDNNNVTAEEFQESSNKLVAVTQELAKKLEVPMLDDYSGFAKSYVRCLQLAEVGNLMKDVIDFSIRNKIGPIESLAKFPKKPRIGDHGEDQLQQQQQHQNGNHDLNNGGRNNGHTPGMQIGSSSNGTLATSSTVQIHNSVDSRVQNSVNGEENAPIQPPNSLP